MASHCAITFLDLPGCCVPEPFTATFDAPIVGGLGGDFTFDNPTAPNGWSVHGATAGSSSPTLALYFGDPADHRYDDPAGGRVHGEATSPEIEVQAGRSTFLSFKLYAAVDLFAEEDRFSVELERTDTGVRVVVFEKTDLSPGQFQTWVQQSIEITSQLGSTPSILHFLFDSVNGTFNTLEGVYFDEIRITTTCAP